MKLITGKKENKVFVGVLDSTERKVLAVSHTDSMVDCIAKGEEFLQEIHEKIKAASEEDYFQIEEVTLLSPITNPPKNIICVGKNYVDHAIEMGSKEDIPEHIMVFSKAPTTIIGPADLIKNHLSITKQLDYEGELAIVIGKKGTNIKIEEALSYCFGYTIVNDVTARDLQEKHKQFFLGKSLDTSCPMGPFLVHKESIGNPNSLQIETRVNGEVRQSSNTKHFIFSVEEIISTISKGMTLEPGDVIATGTPAGVGKGFKPPRFLKPGDQIEITIEGIGTLTNKVSLEI
ncbi:fumarylacetoacetate hydrolase family protein [Robertmurraya korlensis]|uniref:fumarylacetoacetate hydrolase family protein n=1 Tax=Robertmurraya korlensis TaxID=519977 RepID=UPI000825E7DE|nr:fumarylacetoacetate hydrolase family protein [Robertmurraya korlensis]